MFNESTTTINWEGKELTLKTGKIARQADGAVIASMGDTIVLSTVCINKEVREGANFLPLTVHYKEMYFAAGKIPGGFIKRESKASEKEVLTSRLIDRPFRPMFSEYFYNEVQVICTVLSVDNENDPEILAFIATSAALAISGAPLKANVGAARVGLVEGKFILNPTHKHMEESSLDLIVAATSESIMMVESEASEINEEVMIDALSYGHEKVKIILKGIEDFASKIKKEPFKTSHVTKDNLISTIEKEYKDVITQAYLINLKSERRQRLLDIKSEAIEKFANDNDSIVEISNIVNIVEEKIVRSQILNNKRIDNRNSKEIRQIECEVSLLPRTHGSALFTRGETQALVVATLGTGTDEQTIDSIEKEYKQYFMLHYNFPPYSVGETSPLRAPGRREIGHGKLAWKALKAVLPAREDFPYSMRVVAEITDCNGSSSMATVCGTSLAMMDAGIPIKAPVAGIAMGLVKEGEKFVILSDIIGDEDHLGDMDFKVAGTKSGITALQMDIKIAGINLEIMKQALAQAKEGRFHILDIMDKTLIKGRESLSKYAPQILQIKVPKDKIREIIGPGGKVIREICEVSGAKIDISDDGTVSVSGIGREKCDLAIKMITDLVEEPEMGKIYEGKVLKVMDFGAIVSLCGSHDGFLHISEISTTRIENIRDYVKEGDQVKVKVVGFDKGKPRVSMKALIDQSSEVKKPEPKSFEPKETQAEPKKIESEFKEPKTSRKYFQ